MDGVLLVNKERGISSHSVVYKLRKILNTKDIGHCGTLDPLAEGLLVVVIGKALKIARFLTEEKKEYEACIKLGVTTPSLDEETEISEKKEIPFLDEKIIKEVLESFLGKSKQRPPLYSALSINGKKLYEYARENKKVSIDEREIEIYKIELIDFDKDSIKFKVLCSKGTYIRTLCQDIALRLNTIGYMLSLKRLKAGDFDLKDSYTIEDIKNGKYELLSIENALKKNFNIIVANEDDLKEIKHGHPLKKEYKGRTLFLDEKRNPLGMYEYNSEKRLTMCLRLF